MATIPGLENWNTGEIYAEYRSPIDGALLEGDVTVTLKTRLTSTADDAIIPPGVVIDKIPLNTSGEESFRLTLPATDDPDIDQINWGYSLRVVLKGYGGNPSISETFEGVPVPMDGETNLRLIVPKESSPLIPPSMNFATFARIGSGRQLVDSDGNPITVDASREIVSISDDDRDGIATIVYSDGTTTPLPLPSGGGGLSPAQVNALIAQALDTHRVAPTPHKAYDEDIPDLKVLFENGLI